MIKYNNLLITIYLHDNHYHIYLEQFICMTVILYLHDNDDKYVLKIEIINLLFLKLY